MNRRTFLKTLQTLILMAGTMPSIVKGASSSTQDLQPIMLPKPQKDGGKSVLAALWDRRTNRNISAEKFPLQVLSNLIWAAWGVNREERPFGGQLGRTAASASNSQEIDLYVVLSEGIYLYEAVPHRLFPVTAGDHRRNIGGSGGRRDSLANAPVNFIYVVDIAKYDKSPKPEPGLRDPEVQKMYYGVATGHIAGNVYLFAASQGLAAWFHNCNKRRLPGLLNLRPEQQVLFAQTVGYPVKS